MDSTTFLEVNPKAGVYKAPKIETMRYVAVLAYRTPAHTCSTSNKADKLLRLLTQMGIAQSKIITNC